MEKVSIVGVDISKRVFQLHGSTASGRPVFVKKLSRGGFLPFLKDLPPCLVVMEHPCLKSSPDPDFFGGFR